MALHWAEAFNPRCWSLHRALSSCPGFAFCTWVALLWNVMGTDTGLMSACTPRAKCNYMLSQATIKKEAAVNRHSSRMVMQLTVFAGQGWEERVERQRETERERERLNSLWDRSCSSICQHWHFTIALFAWLSFTSESQATLSSQKQCVHTSCRSVGNTTNRPASPGRKMFCEVLHSAPVCASHVSPLHSSTDLSIWKINTRWCIKKVV